MNKLVAVVGMCGSGKSVATDILEKQGWHKIYFGGVTYKKMHDEGITITPDTERIFRENLRDKFGPECYAKLLLPEIKEALKKKNVVLDGLYSWYEYKYLEKNLEEKINLIGVIADKDIRYKRVSKRIARPFNNQKVKERDLTEIENLYKGGPIAYADYYIFNNGTLEEYKTRLEEIIKQIQGCEYDEKND